MFSETIHRLKSPHHFRAHLVQAEAARMAFDEEVTDFLRTDEEAVRFFLKTQDTCHE